MTVMSSVDQGVMPNVLERVEFRGASWQGPVLSALAAVLGLLWAADRSCAQNLARTKAPNADWSCLACSGDGRVIVAAACGSGWYETSLVYVSTNSGAAWSAAGLPCRVWSSVTSSADGARLAAAVYDAAVGAFTGGPIYVSTNSGQTWTQTTAPTQSWTAVVFSGDGAKLVAAAEDPTYWPAGDIYVSTNLGQTWTPTASSGHIETFSHLASSTDGSRLVGAGGLPALGSAAGPVYTSTDFGASWTSNSVVWASSVASSADGTRLAATADGGGVWTSGDGVATWTQTEAPPFESWSSVASSADGTRLVAISNGREFYTSVDSGATWTAVAGEVDHWCAVASSADGSRLAAATGGGGIYVSTRAF